jgi:hypothetical protein
VRHQRCALGDSEDEYEVEEELERRHLLLFPGAQARPQSGLAAVLAGCHRG